MKISDLYMNINSMIVAALLFFAATNIYSSENRIFTGYLIDVETNKPIQLASVEIIGSNYKTISNNEGKFQFAEVGMGKIVLKILHIAYQEKLIELDFLKDNRQNFIIYLVPKTIEISAVTISDKHALSSFEDLQELSSVLKGRELQKDLGLTLAATLKNETGLAMRAMGPAPARPVIRGLGGDRVLLTEDGLKSTDLSSTSPDHAVTIEPFSSNRIEVLRGPKVLTKSPVTIGGIVNVIKEEIPSQIHDEIYGTAGVYSETANKGFLGALSAEIPFSPFTTRFEISRRVTSDLRSPEGILNNSDSKNFNYSLGSSFFTSFGYLGISFRNFELDYGVPGGFVGAHPFGVDISLYRQQINVKSVINFDSQRFNSMKINLASSLYRHKEFENSGRIGSEFRIKTILGSVEVNQDKLWFFENGIWGINFEKRDFDIGGFVFTVPAISTNFSAFFFESFKAGKTTFESAARINFDKITPEIEKPNSKIGHIRERIFSTYSLSLSILYPLTEIVYIGSNISKSSRIPTIEELYSEGPHLAAYSYEVGNPELNAEEGLGTEIFVYHKFKKLYYNMNVFWNRLDNYIIPRNTGLINYATFLPIYSTSSAKVDLYGVEFQTDWNFYKNLSFNTSFSYTRGIFHEGASSLPQIPPLKGIAEILLKEEEWSTGISTEFTLAQNHVDTFESSTAGYIIFNLFGQYSFNTHGQIHTISINVENVFDRIYRNHLSRVKSILPEAGINLRATYKLYFHI
jgi:iron complex outermembrane receptor protein